MAATRVYIKLEQNYIATRPFYESNVSNQQTQKANKDEKLVFKKEY